MLKSFQAVGFSAFERVCRLRAFRVCELTSDHGNVCQRSHERILKPLEGTWDCEWRVLIRNKVIFGESRQRALGWGVENVAWCISEGLNSLAVLCKNVWDILGVVEW